MESLGKWSINNRVTVNLIMIFIIVAGLITVMNMRRELNPQYALDIINISVVYPWARAPWGHPGQIGQNGGCEFEMVASVLMHKC